MELKQALQVAESLRRQRPARVFTSIAYQYGRGCYAVIVHGEEETVALVNEDALTAYRAAHQTAEAD